MSLSANKVIVIGIKWNVKSSNQQDEILNYLNSKYKNVSTICDIFDDDSYDTVKDIAIENIENKINEELNSMFNDFQVSVDDYIDIQTVLYKQEKTQNKQLSKNKIVYSTVKQPPKYDDR